MSDEYASSGFQGSLVNPCPFVVLSFPASGEFLTPCHAAAIGDILPPRERETYPPSSDYATKNYPPPGDTTSSGGRRTNPGPQPDSVLAGQQAPSGAGTDLHGQLREAKQGRDPSAESLDTRKEAAEALANRYRASRAQLHETGGSGVDVGE
ncbi:hypothetical protein BC826DRAFT_1034989 [Russula brevipes]|nr:hypothetical protein BC826DRAFT_1034989 [Russula brevipes]